MPNKKKFIILFLLFMIFSQLFALGQKKTKITRPFDYELAAQWTMYGNDINHSNKIKSNIKPPFTELWRKKKISNNKNVTPVVYNGILFAVISNNKLIAFNTENGDALWEFTNDTNVTTTPLVLESFIFLGDEKGEMLCLSTYTGKKIWAKNTQSKFSNSAPTPDLFSIYIGAANGWIYRMSVEDGNIKWGAKIKESIKTTLAQDDTNLYIASFDSCLYSINKNTKNIDWEINLLDKLNISPSVDKNKVYVSANKIFYAINKTKGEIFWKKEFLLDEIITNPIALSDDKIYVSTNKGIYLIEKETGKVIWKLDIVEPTTPILTDKFLFIGNQKGDLFVYDNGTGKKIWKKQVLNEKIIGLVISEEKLFVWSESEICVFQGE